MNQLSYKFFVFILLFLSNIISSHVLASSKMLTLGVFAYLPKAVMIERYQPLVNYLNKQLSPSQIKLRVLELDEIESALANKELDFIFTNPRHYIILRQNHKLSGAIATLIKHSGSGNSTQYLGGVIFTRSSQTDINQLSDLKGRTIAIPSTKHMGGYQAQAYELFKAGIKLPEDVNLIKLGSHDKVLYSVLSGKAEVGFVRTEILETMSLNGQFNLNQIKVINSQNKLLEYYNKSLDRQESDIFPFITSTRLYPEWPFVSLSHVKLRIVSRIASALLAISNEQLLIQKAGISGFAPPADYIPVEEVARTLRLYPYNKSPDFTLLDIWYKHKEEISSVLFFFIINILLIIIIFKRSRQTAEQMRLTASVFSNSREGILITDKNNYIVEINPACIAITGYTREELIGRTPDIFNSGMQDPSFYKQLWQELSNSGHWQGEIWNRKKTGEIYSEKLSIDVVSDKKGKLHHYVAVFFDTSYIKEHETELAHIAHYDFLTSLPNRVLLQDRIQQALLKVQRNHELVAICYLDLDNFKQINKLYGPKLGDKILVELAKRLCNIVRSDVTVSRIGGDEFALVIQDTIDIPQLQLMLTRILQVISKPYLVSSKKIETQINTITASIGVTLYPQDNSAADMLLRHADQAMYIAKQRGKNCYSFFSPKIAVKSTTNTDSYTHNT
jgi:diguanylate cyclase (GGDEF)-like protein/PAS domain S-box-containing protein